MKKVIAIVTLFLAAAVMLSAQEFTDTYTETMRLENEALDILPQYGDVLRGIGYIPDVDFEVVNSLYRDIISTNPDNPFYYAAYGFTFYYMKQQDSAGVYFEKASERAGLNVTAHLRLFQLYYAHRIKSAQEYELDRFESVKYRTGANSLPEVAAFLNVMALDFVQQEKSEEAFEYLLKANALDPSNMQIASNYLRLAVKKGNYENVGQGIRMVRGALNDMFWKFIMMYNAIKYIRYLTFALFMVLTLMFFAKNADEYVYLIKRIMPKRLNSLQISVIAYAILFLPLILQFSPILWFFYLSFINFLFIRRREKILITFLLILLIFMPFMFRFENHLLGVMGPDDNISIVLKADNSGWDHQLLVKINQRIEEEPFNTLLFFGKAKMYKKGGYFNEAEEEYNKILLSKDEFAELYNNLGNIMFYNGYYSKAEDYYKKAVELSDKLPQPYFNLGQVYLREMLLSQSDEYIRKATELDNDMINNFMENAAENYHNTEIIDCNLPERYIWNEFLKKTEIRDTPVFMGVRINLISMIALFTLLASAFIGSLLKHRLKIRRCHTCNRPITEKDKKMFNEYELCAEDFDMLEKTISDNLRARKFESLVRMKQKSFFRKRRAASLIFPGFSKIIEGKQTKGMLLIVPAVMSILFLLSDRLFITKNPQILNQINLETRWVPVFILVVLYVISVSVTKEEK